MIFSTQGKKKKRASTQSRTCPVAELHRPVPRLLLVQKMIIVLVLQKMTSFCVIAKHGCKIVRLERSPCSRVFRDVIRNPDVYPWHFDLSVGFCLTAAPEIKSVLFSYWQKWEKNGVNTEYINTIICKFEFQVCLGAHTTGRFQHTTGSFHAQHGTTFWLHV